jgi:hypothetical protein
MSNKISVTKGAAAYASQQLGIDLKRSTQPQLAQLDLDKNGKVERAEVKALKEVADLNGSGFVDKSERKAAVARLLGASEPWSAQTLAQAQSRTQSLKEQAKATHTDAVVEMLRAREALGKTPVPTESVSALEARRAPKGNDLGSTVNSLWYGGPYKFGANVSGTYSEKASYGGQPGIGSWKFATRAEGGDLAIAVTGLHGKNPQPTRVLAIDAGKVLSLNGGVWPGEPEQMKAFLQQHGKEVILADVEAKPPQLTKLSGIPKGTQVTVIAGAEALLGNPPKMPPASQAMVTNFSQLPPAAQELLGGAKAGARPAPQSPALDAQIRYAKAEAAVTAAQAQIDRLDRLTRAFGSGSNGVVEVKEKAPVSVPAAAPVAKSTAVEKAPAAEETDALLHTLEGISHALETAELPEDVAFKESVDATIAALNQQKGEGEFNKESMTACIAKAAASTIEWAVGHLEAGDSRSLEMIEGLAGALDGVGAVLKMGSATQTVLEKLSEAYTGVDASGEKVSKADRVKALAEAGLGAKDFLEGTGAVMEGGAFALKKVAPELSKSLLEGAEMLGGAAEFLAILGPMVVAGEITKAQAEWVLTEVAGAHQGVARKMFDDRYGAQPEVLAARVRAMSTELDQSVDTVRALMDDVFKGDLRGEWKQFLGEQSGTLKLNLEVAANAVANDRNGQKPATQAACMVAVHDLRALALEFIARKLPETTQINVKQ